MVVATRLTWRVVNTSIIYRLVVRSSEVVFGCCSRYPRGIQEESRIVNTRERLVQVACNKTHNSLEFHQSCLSHNNVKNLSKYSWTGSAGIDVEVGVSVVSAVAVAAADDNDEGVDLR